MNKTQHWRTADHETIGYYLPEQCLMRHNNFHRIPVVRFSFLLLLLFATTTLASLAKAAPNVVSPIGNATLSGTTQIFSWTADETVERWWLYVGTSTGARDIVDSGDLGTNTEYKVIGIPVDSSMVHARLWYFSAGRWYYTDSVYTAALIDDVATPAMINPANNSTLSGGSTEFQWQDNNTPVNFWWLYVGSSPGGRDIYDSGTALRNSNSVVIDQLPTDGSTFHVRLWYRTYTDGWRFTDLAYTATYDPAPATDTVSDTFAGNGPLINYTTNNASALPDVKRLNGRYHATLLNNDNNVTLHFNGRQGRLDAKRVAFPFEFIARNIGIGSLTNSQVAPSPDDFGSSASVYAFAGIQIHALDLEQRDSAHFVVGHRGSTSYTVEGKNTVNGRSAVNDAGQGILPTGRADLRVVGHADRTLSWYWQQPNLNSATQADDWIAYRGNGNFPGRQANFENEVYIGLITYGYNRQSVGFVGTCDAIELVPNSL